MKNTNDLSNRLLRLPLWLGLTGKNQEKIIYSICNIVL
jgi:dTDP-4-amino-4,6-dideoxygalactose transaminase